MRRALPHLLIPLVFFIALAVSLGQYRRVTNDIPHGVDQLRAALAPLHGWRLEDIVLVGPSGHAETLPQARLTMAPCILHADDAPRRDTTLFVVLPADTARILQQNVLWRARDDAYYYALVAP